MFNYIEILYLYEHWLNALLQLIGLQFTIFQPSTSTKQISLHTNIFLFYTFIKEVTNLKEYLKFIEYDFPQENAKCL